jgi:hypothetical protein
MEIYRGFYGRWNVDWDLVAYLDPEYAKKYLVKPKYQTAEEYKEKMVSQTTIGVDNGGLTQQREQADRLIQRERERARQAVNGYGRHIPAEDLSEEDKAILDLMHTETKPAAPAQPARITAAIPIPPMVEHVDEILGTDGKDDDVFLLPGNNGTTTRRRECIKAKSNYRYGEYRPSIEHTKSIRTNPPPPTVPLLPLPRNFLAPSSTRVINDVFEYSVQPHPLLDDHSTFTGHAVLEDDTYLKIITYQFTLNKIYNSYKPSNILKKRIVFNKKTGNMFAIMWERKDKKKKGRTYKKIIGLSIQTSFLIIHSDSFPAKHLWKFTHRMLDLTKEKIGQEPIAPISIIPDSPRDEMCKCILAYLWQHKVGQVLPWINSGVMEAVAGIRESWASYHGGRCDELELKIFKKKLIGKGLFAKLRKKPRPTTLFKSLLGPAYSNTAYKLALIFQGTYQCYSLIGLMELMCQNKRLHHFVSHLTNAGTNDAKHVIKILVGAIDEMGFGRERKEKKPVFIKYIKALEAQFPNLPSEEQAISWELFRDTISMAERYNISINANQLCKYKEIRKLHTRFVMFMNRDVSVQRELAGIEFVEFPHPDKEYKEFTFQFLKNAEELIEEGRTMNHCVGGYGTRCVSGQSIIFSMRKNGVGFVTLELDGDDPRLKIVQKYSRHDVTITNPEILEVIDQWHKDVLELNRNKPCTYGDQCSIISRYVSGIITLVDKNTPEEMKASVRQTTTNDDKIIDGLGLRDYVKRVLANNDRLASKLHDEDVSDCPDPWNILDTRPLPRAVQVPTNAYMNNTLEADNG